MQLEIMSIEQLLILDNFGIELNNILEYSFQILYMKLTTTKFCIACTF